LQIVGAEFPARPKPVPTKAAAPDDAAKYSPETAPSSVPTTAVSIVATEIPMHFMSQ